MSSLTSSTSSSFSSGSYDTRLGYLSPTQISPLAKRMMTEVHQRCVARHSIAANICVDASKQPPRQIPPPPEQQAGKERLDSALGQSEDLLANIIAQLDAPISAFLPKDLTPEEKAEQAESEKFMNGCRITDDLTATMLKDSNDLFNELMGSMDAMEMHGFEVLSSETLLPRPQPRRKEVKVAQLNMQCSNRCTCVDAYAMNLVELQPLDFTGGYDVGGLLCHYCLGF
ncbi:hypothetical protein LTR62_007165 [Meristemomyces frigidus]|uniref:Uncharacterized protein n=1 Tax=Meristemomyces frigidus TaxID=1508187 RepID=A0AAN7YP55_9PEZI|nr:hypothetical protein LTR62_007165 [Meristemomyces frigidus]